MSKSSHEWEADWYNFEGAYALAVAELELEQRVAATAVSALVGIAQADFRGNRSHEQQVAWQTLQDIEKMREAQ